MDEATPFGEDITDDHEFEAAQDGEIPAEAEAEIADDDERPVGDEPQDEVVGIDEERRVVLPDEPGADEAE
jgi:hypothetical protein